MDRLGDFTLVVFDKSDLGINHLPEEFGLGSGEYFKTRLAAELGVKVVAFFRDRHDQPAVIIAANQRTEARGGNARAGLDHRTRIKVFADAKLGEALR